MGPHTDRLASIQRRLGATEAAAVVVSPSRNLQYLTGFADEPSERALFLILPADREPRWFTPDLAAQQLTERTPIEVVRTWTDAEGPEEPLFRLLDELDLDGKHVLVEETMWARFTQLLESQLPQSTFGLADELFSGLRIHKDDAELDALQTAANAADHAMRQIRALGSDAVGMTEAELASRIAAELTAAGGEELSFEPLVGSGPNGAMPHHTHGDREIAAGEPVVLDFGTRIAGYPSDQTRTVVFDGEPNEEFKQVHSVVREAQQAAIETIEPGISAGEVDAAARDPIEQAGYGDRFIHRTGHGVGLSIHEAPEIVAGSERLLEPKMVFSIEPGIYLPGEFGVRIEDLVVVTQEGCRRLNTTSRDWRI